MPDLTQAEEVHALYERFVLGADSNATRTAADVPTPGPGVSPPPPVSDRPWFDPTDAARAAFCSKHGLDVRQIEPWTFDEKGNIHKATDGTKLVSFPVLLALAVDDIENLKEYAGCGGYGPDGVARLQTAIAFGRARGKAYQVWQAVNPEEALRGSSYADNDTVAYGLCAGNVDLNDFQNLHFGGGTSIPAVATTMYRTSSRKPGDPGAGVAGV